MRPCPTCNTQTVTFRHCLSPTCTWEGCPICRSFGDEAHWQPYLVPTTLEALYAMDSIADADRIPPPPGVCV